MSSKGIRTPQLVAKDDSCSWQRASRVEVSAVRNETVDYAKLYASTQSALDSKVS